MAFANKIGNLVKQVVASKPSVYQAIRCMSSSKLFVGGLSYGTEEHGLREAFNQYGTVVEARVIYDRETNRSRGFGFVTLTSTEEAEAAIQGLDGKDLHGRIVRVNYATERTGGYRSGGNYGGDGSYANQGNYGGYGNQGTYNNASTGGYGGDSNYGGENYNSVGGSYSGGVGSNVAGGSGGSDGYGGVPSDGYTGNVSAFGGSGSTSYGSADQFDKPGSSEGFGNGAQDDFDLPDSYANKQG